MCSRWCRQAATAVAADAGVAFSGRREPPGSSPGPPTEGWPPSHRWGHPCAGAGRRAVGVGGKVSDVLEHAREAHFGSSCELSYLGVTIPGPSKREGHVRQRISTAWTHALRWAGLHGGHDGGGGVEGAEGDGRGGVRGVKGNDLEQLCAGWDLSKQRWPVVQVARVIRESNLGLQLDLCVATGFGCCGGQGSLSLPRRKQNRKAMVCLTNLEGRRKVATSRGAILTVTSHVADANC